MAATVPRMSTLPAKQAAPVGHSPGCGDSALLTVAPSCRSAAPPKAAAMLWVSKKVVARAPAPAVVPWSAAVGSTGSSAGAKPSAWGLGGFAPTRASVAGFVSWGGLVVKLSV